LIGNYEQPSPLLARGKGGEKKEKLGGKRGARKRKSVAFGLGANATMRR